MSTDNAKARRSRNPHRRAWHRRSPRAASGERRARSRLNNAFRDDRASTFDDRASTRNDHVDLFVQDSTADRESGNSLFHLPAT
jgi:hypothetical protein